MKKRFLAVLLAAVMVFSVAGAVIADEPLEPTEPVRTVVVVPDTPDPSEPGSPVIDPDNPGSPVIDPDNPGSPVIDPGPVDPDNPGSPLIDPGGVVIPDLSGDSSGYTTLAEAGAYLRDQMIAKTAAIEISVDRTAPNFSGYTDSDSDINKLFFDLLEEAYKECDNPKAGDYLRFQTAIDESPIGYNESVFTVTYNVNYFMTSAQEAAVDSQVASVLAELDLANKADDYKIAKIYDYITSHVVYDYTNLNNSSYKLKYTAYAALINGTAVCQGYTCLFYRMLRQAGISARIISGTGRQEAHAWVIVGINGQYYDTDATWDTGKAPSQYTYFLKCESEFSDHSRNSEYASEAFNVAYPMASASLAYPDSAKVPVTGIVLDSTSGYVLYGQPYRVQATVEPADAFDTSVNFDIIERTVGYSSSKSNQGGWIEITPTAPSDGRTGTIVVKISSVSDPEVSATCTIKTVSTAADLDIDAIQLSGNSLSLHGDIGVNFYMDMKASVANRAVIHYSTPNGGDGTVSLGDGLTVDENTGSYKFTVNMVAKEMRDVITITVKDTEGNPITLLSNSLATDYTDGYEYSIARYLELAKESTDEKLVALAEAMDNYGEYAQVYFGYNSSGVVPDSTAINNITAETVAENVSNYNKVKTGILPEGLAYYGTSLTLEAETLINHYFTVESGHNIDEYSFTAVGKDLTPVSAGSNYYRVTLEGIPAAELGTYTTTEVGLSGENSTYTIQYSGMSYVYSTLSKETVNENLGNLCKALYVYHQKAKGLFTS
ncbi:MAG: hypothetical protein IJH99_09450 [Eubacterium sp.]|nr:hypothetical protein [Eubacterium sp.]